MPTNAAQLQKAKGSAGLGFKVGITLLGLAALAAAPLVMILIPGMMPTVVTLFVERQRPRHHSYTVGVMNFAGVLPILLTVATGHFTMTAAGQALANPMTWIVMYGAAAAGWLICGATLPLARLCLEVQASHKRRTLEALSKAICEEWGDDAAGQPGRPAAPHVERDNRP